MKYTKAMDITGYKSGKLTAISICAHKNKHGQRLWLCECECGNIFEILQHSLTSGNSTKCKLCPRNEYLLEDNIEGADRYFICMGGEYIATPAYFTGEWLEINFNDVQKSNSGFNGTHINHSHTSEVSYTNESIPNNLPPKFK